MLLVLFELKIFLVFLSHVSFFNQARKVLLNLEKLGVLSVFLVVGNNWNPVVDLVPETVN